jgi:hypothetical protein
MISTAVLTEIGERIAEEGPAPHDRFLQHLARLVADSAPGTAAALGDRGRRTSSGSGRRPSRAPCCCAGPLPPSAPWFLLPDPTTRRAQAVTAAGSQLAA